MKIEACLVFAEEGDPI